MRRSRKYPHLLRLAPLLLAACAGAATDPSRTLVGEWGSPDALLIALRSGAELRLACSILIIDDPIDLSATNSFQASS
jgi:hypothetical protein